MLIFSQQFFLNAWTVFAPNRSINKIVKGSLSSLYI